MLQVCVVCRMLQVVSFRLLKLRDVGGMLHVVRKVSNVACCLLFVVCCKLYVVKVV